MKNSGNTIQKILLIGGFLDFMSNSMNLWEFVKKIPFFNNVHRGVFEISVLVVCVIFSWILIRWYRKYQCRKIPIPKPEYELLKKYVNDSNLKFRYNENKDCIINTAKIEEYGGRGETDIEQVFKWWLLYRGAAIVMTYKEKIIGGIDLYPIKQDIYKKMLDGELEEEDLTNPTVQFDPYMIGVTDKAPRNGTFWYIAGISLSAVFRKKRDRLELLIRLIVNTAEKWLEPKPPSPNYSTKLRKPLFPAHLIAISWTKEGANLLAHGLEFSYRCKDKSGDEVYEKIFTKKEDVEIFIQKYKARLEN